ncbi:type VI secretion system tip protein VgrG [Pseudomonas sp. UYIF39]|uniref:type VI secretion system tip protein TssI/VgrG n=1 Tax=Pseudomonas sp. UYIF39 TaxID=1630747 RepID=UPI00249EED9E|nr:type VI secretion system tip protein TssI/VgrG [Pseudomonas sp. UYIF39]MDI3353171.1 type VI secretion system tip protein VgrG [Pseudomonas sp. UYIF39]
MLDANATHISLTLEGVSVDLQVLSFVGRETLNQPFCFDIELVSARPDLKLEELLHKPGCLTFGATGKGIIHGLVYRIEQGDSGKSLTRYSISLVPQLAYLRHNHDQQIFQHLSVPKIIAQVLEARGILADAYSFQLGAIYPERNYCVQYDESDLHFIQRLCEEEGIHFHFQHSSSGHKLVFGDDQTVFRKLAPVAYQQDSGMAAEKPVIKRFNLRLETRTTRVSRRDYDFEKPRILPEGAAKSAFAPDLEDYDYPGRFTDRERGKQLATRALERHRSDYKLAEGKGDEPTLVSGHFMALSEHPRAEWNDLWLLLEVVHEGKQPQVLGANVTSDVTQNKDDFHQGYRNRFLATPWDAHFRPALEHPKPKVLGSQTAIVTGPAGEEIHCDEYGRVKVQFHWDREGQADDKTSCWLRVATGWAGSAYGGIAIPRIGMEVLVSFMEGDPDQPLITGCLYHKENVVPYDLPANKTRSTFKTLSSPGGKGYNEFRIEDKKGAEQIYLHAQRDWDENIEHDQKIRVGNERHDTVEANVLSEFKVEEHRITHLDRKTETRADDHLTVAVTQHVKVGTAQFVEAGQEIHYNAGEKVVVEGGMELTAKAGGSFVKIDAGGVTISGAEVKVNSGGRPGAGTGIQILTPLIPGAAAAAIAGQLLSAPPVGKLSVAPDSAPPAVEEEFEEEEEEVELEDITLRVGMFFDGTGNNRNNSERVFGCFAPDVNLEEAAEDIRQFCAAHGYDGKGSSPDNSYGNDVSNVARLYDLYLDQRDITLPIDARTASLRVYVDGIGTSSTEADSTFSQGTGIGAQGVRARAEETPPLILRAIQTFQDNNPDKRVAKIEFDIFGFSRGSAAARDFANEVLKGNKSILAKVLPMGAPILSDSFAWTPHSDVSINFIGVYDTVAAIANPLVGDWTGNNAYNPGINIHLAPEAAKKVVQLVARNERRYNFALNSLGAADIVLPGVHSDLGGGYLPKAMERILLSKPRKSPVEERTTFAEANSYKVAQQDLRRFQDQLAQYNLPLEIRTWEVPFRSTDKDDQKNMKYVYAAVSSQREVRSELSLIYFRIMRELAVENGVPFRQIPEKNPRLALPADLVPISEKLMAYAQGKSKSTGLTPQEEELLFQRYVHISDNWNAAKSRNNSDLNIVFINRPDENSVRTVHPNE